MKLHCISHLKPELSDGKFLGEIRGQKVSFTCKGIVWLGRLDQEAEGEGCIPCIVEVKGHDVYVFPNPYPKDLGKIESSGSQSDWEHEQFCDQYDPENDCPRCQGSGTVTTADYESYFGDQFKTCPECGGNKGRWS